MAMDFSKVVSDLNKHSSSDEGSGKKYRYRLVYPSEGKLRVRILFNPASGLVTRLVNRHKIGNNQIPCMATYTSKADCPICKIIEEAENMGVGVPYSAKSKARAICLAQYHSSSYEIDGVKKGDIIMLMVPWSIYKGINKWMQDFANEPEIMARVFGANEANVFIIEHGKEITDWDSRPDPNVTITSAKDDEDFARLLEEQMSLYDLVENIHELPTEDDAKLMQSVAEDLRTSLIAPKAIVPEQSTVAVEAKPVVSTPVAPQTAGGLTGDEPDCYGNYVPEDTKDPMKLVQKVKCKLCPFKGACSSVNG